MKGVCAVASCDVAIRASGWCAKHYTRYIRHGDPLALMIREKGTGTVTRGYVVKVSGGRHQYKRIREHTEVAERALGHKLPSGAVVHHVNEITTDNRPENLVICPSSGYHQILHMRMRALSACGNADWRRCFHCRQYDDPTRMRVDARAGSACHHACAAAYGRERRNRLKAALAK